MPVVCPAETTVLVDVPRRGEKGSECRLAALTSSLNVCVECGDSDETTCDANIAVPSCLSSAARLSNELGYPAER